MNASTSAPTRPRPPRPKPELFVELLVTPDGQTDGVISITRGRDTADYLLAPLPSGPVRYFLVQKIGRDGMEPPYFVSLAGDERSCDCQGHRRYGHCKHADALATLIAAGRL
jgi:hypothetical protein